MTTTHRGFVRVSQKVILDFLQFPNGQILQARIDDYGHLEFCISDAEMPEVFYLEPTPVISLTYNRYEDTQGHWVAVRNPVNVPIPLDR